MFFSEGYRRYLALGLTSLVSSYVSSDVSSYVRFCFFCLNDQAHFAWFTSGAAQGWKPTFDGRRPLTEDDLRRKTTFNGRRLMMEVDVWWKRTYDGGRLMIMMEDNLWWKTTFDGRRPLMEDNLWRKMTFDRVTVYIILLLKCLSKMLKCLSKNFFVQ